MSLGAGTLTRLNDPILARFEGATTGEIVEAAEIERLSKSKPRASRLTDEERAQVEARIAELGDERAVRVAEHRERIAAKARWLGREVAVYRMTLADAERRLDALVHTLDAKAAAPVALVPFVEAAAIAQAAFDAAFVRVA